MVTDRIWPKGNGLMALDMDYLKDSHVAYLKGNIWNIL